MGLVLTEGTAGMIEASTAKSASTPRTAPVSSTTLPVATNAFFATAKGNPTEKRP